MKEDPGALAADIAGLPGGEKARLLILVARDQAARARMELLRGMRGDPDEGRGARPRRTVAELLDTAAEFRAERHRQAEAETAAREALREQQAAARQRRLDALAKDPAAWAEAGKLIGTSVPRNARHSPSADQRGEKQSPVPAETGASRRSGSASRATRRPAAGLRDAAHVNKI
ncbi:MAG TPA: hypothetical protein VIV12_16485 [Streptosporangiaceae bacterium]